MALGSTTDLNIKIDATTASAEAGVARLTRSTTAYESSLRRAQVAAAQLDRQLKQESAQAYAAQTQAIQTAGRGLLLFGGATAAGLALSAKAAVDWESAWTGVRKTLDGSDAELARAETGLRNLAKTLPTSHEEIAAVAEAAGQLGIKAKDIVPFTKVMIDLGQTTNLTADQAATAMARFGNIMQTPQSEVDRLGSSLVALGNNGASTEAEILTMGNRIAAAGQLVGLTEGEVLGLANAMSSLGIEAEAGGTAISMTLREISSAVAEGGDGLSAFAEVAGMSADEFGRLFTRDAAAGLEAFTSGLGRVKKQGGDVNATLAGLEITGVRQVDTLLRLAQSGDQLADSLELGNDAYRENSALAEEANKRYDTTAAKLEIAKNQVVDLGISLGEHLLPILGKTAGVLSDVGSAVNSLPEPVKGLITTFGVAAGTLALVGGAGLTMVGKFRDMRGELGTTREWFQETNKGALAARSGALALAAGLPILTSALGATSEGANDVVTILSGAATGFAVTGGPWGAAIGAMVGGLAAMSSGSNDAAEAQARLDAEIQEVSGTLNEQTGALTRNTTEWVNKKLADDGVFDAAERLGIELGLVTQAALGQEDAVKRLNSQMSQFAGEDFGSEKHSDVIQITKAVGESSAAIDGARQSARQGREASEDLGRSYKNTGSNAEDAAKAIRELVAAQRAAAVAAIQNKRDQLALISTMQSAREEARKGRRTLNENTQAGRDNWAALLDLADQWENSANKVRNADGAYKDVRRTFIDVAMEMGASEKRAKKLADRFLSVPGAAGKAARGAKDAAVDIGESLRSIPNESVRIDLTSGASKIWATISPGFFGDDSVHTQGGQFAMGGSVAGGMQGVDSVPALLMPGEHVFTTSDVRKAGRGNERSGQKVMYAIRRMIQRGELGKLGDVPAFATGGIVQPHIRSRGLQSALAQVSGSTNAIAAAMSAALSREISEWLTELPMAGQLGPNGRLTPAQLVRGQEFARSQAGKPYEWAGVGPGGYDCSGFQSAVLNAATGRYPYSRLGSTGSMPWSGSAPGVGRYTIGWFTGDPGHTSGNIAGLGVESRGGDGVVVGSGATPPVGGMFNSVMHYDKGGIWPHGTLGVNMSGGDELVINPRRMAKGGEVKGPDDKPLTDKMIADILRGIKETYGRNSELVEVIRKWLDGLTRGEFSQKALRERIAKAPVSETETTGVLGQIKDKFGKNSPFVEIVREWLQGLKSGELSNKALVKRLDQAVQKSLAPLLREFNVGPRQTRGETRSEVNEMLRELRNWFGPDAPFIRRIERMGDRLVKVQDRQDKVAAQYERANDKLAEIVDKQRQFASEVRQAFTHDAFGTDVGSIAEARLQARADANDAQRATRQFRRLASRGLDDRFIRQLAASGNTNLITQLSQMSRKEIAAFERDFRRRSRATGQLAELTGRQVFGDERKQQIRVTNRLERRLGDLDRTLNRLERKVEHGVERGAERGVHRGMRDRESRQQTKRRAGAR